MGIPNGDDPIGRVHVSPLSAVANQMVFWLVGSSWRTGASDTSSSRDGKAIAPSTVLTRAWASASRSAAISPVAMGGDVTVTTELGVGSTFTLTLPRAGAALTGPLALSEPALGSVTVA